MAQNLDETTSEGPGADLTVHIKETDGSPILMQEPIAFLENKGYQGILLRGRQCPRREGGVKNVHEI